MNRRSFLHGLFAGAAAVVAAPKLLTGPVEPVQRRLTEAQKAAIIREYIKTPAGRMKLAQAMTQPLRRRVNYTSLGRRVMVVEQLPTA